MRSIQKFCIAQPFSTYANTVALKLRAHITGSIPSVHVKFCSYHLKIYLAMRKIMTAVILTVAPKDEQQSVKFFWFEVQLLIFCEQRRQNFEVPLVVQSIFTLI